jgi:inosine-uridine nucleoside N-ribohydrolase
MIPSLWLDLDLALGARRGDVDDGFALAAALCAHMLGEARLVGVSAVFGNTEAPTAFRCARALCDAVGCDVRVYAGARASGDHDTEAARAIAALPEGTELLALGPLTNVHAALLRDPGLAVRVRTSIVGGNLSSWGRWAPYWPFEFNLAKDIAAAQHVFATQGERRLFLLETCARLRAGAGDLVRWRRGDTLARRLAVGSWRWLAYTPLRYQSLRFPLWDLVPVLTALGAEFRVREEPRCLALVGRGGLRYDAGAPRTQVVSDIDAACAMASFDALLTRHAALNSLGSDPKRVGR